MKIVFPPNLNKIYIPNLEAPVLLEYFLISAFSSSLIIRFYLTVTGFPQIGAGGLHIAHMLWGGLLMLTSIGLLLSFINSEIKITASVIGGIGFGAFIDELGKFITSDNNYFYQPTIAIIYVIFIFLYFVVRHFSSRTTYSKKVYTVNAIESIKEIIIDDLNFDEKEKAVSYLEKADKRSELIKALRKALHKADTKKKKFSLYSYVKIIFLSWYFQALNVKLFAKIIVGIFIIFTAISFIFSLIALPYSFYAKTSITDYGHIASTIISGIFTLIGAVYFFKKIYIKSYNALLKATVVSILLSQFFLFLRNEFVALINLIFFLTVYTVLKFTIKAEKKRLAIE